MSCDWCGGGAADLVWGEEASGEIFKDTGKMVVYYRDKEIASRHVNFCPMCGKRVGIGNSLEVPTGYSFYWTFKKFLLKTFSHDVDLASIVSTQGWSEALKKTCILLDMQDWYKRYTHLEWDNSDHYDSLLLEKLLEDN